MDVARERAERHRTGGPGRTLIFRVVHMRTDTKSEVVALVERNPGGLTLKDMARRIGVSRVAARYHVLHLWRERVVRLERQNGVRGYRGFRLIVKPKSVTVVVHIPHFAPHSIGHRLARELAHVHRANEDTYIAPPGTMQTALAGAVGITRAHASIELRRLIDRGYAEVLLRHVPGVNTRRKTYRLTMAGFRALMETEGGETCEHLEPLFAAERKAMRERSLEEESGWMLPEAAA